MGIIGFVLLVALVFLGLGSQIGRFIDIPVIVIVFGSLIAALLMSFGRKVFSAVGTVFRREADQKSLILAIALFERARSYVVAGGVLGSLIGFMILWKIMDDPAAMGPGMAVALLTQIYPIMIAYAILLPVVASLQRRLEEMEG